MIELRSRSNQREKYNVLDTKQCWYIFIQGIIREESLWKTVDEIWQEWQPKCFMLFIGNRCKSLFFLLKFQKYHFYFVQNQKSMKDISYWKEEKTLSVDTRGSVCWCPAGGPRGALSPLHSLLDRPLSLGPRAWSWGFPVVREHVLTCWVDAFILDPWQLRLSGSSRVPSTLFTLDNPVKVAIASSGITTLPLCSAPNTTEPTAWRGEASAVEGIQAKIKIPPRLPH